MDWKSEVGRAMSAHFDARRSGDIETVISSYSDDWTDSKGFTKDSLRDGHLAFTIGATTENVQINLDEVRITHDGDFKNYSPVTIHTSKGTISYAYTLKKESDDVWRIIYTKTLNWGSWQHVSVNISSVAELSPVYCCLVLIWTQNLLVGVQIESGMLTKIGKACGS